METTEHSAVGGKKAATRNARPKHLFQYALGSAVLAALAPWNRLKIYKSHLRNLANTPPFVEVQPNLQKKGSMLYRCQQIHIIYKQTIQTSIQTKLIDLFEVFSGGLAKFPEFIYKEYFCSKSKFGGFHGGFQHFATWRIQQTQLNHLRCPGS